MPKVPKKPVHNSPHFSRLASQHKPTPNRKPTCLKSKNTTSRTHSIPRNMPKFPTHHASHPAAQQICTSDPSPHPLAQHAKRRGRVLLHCILTAA
ncbi:hypothetical protein IQ06DRAFT_291991 [Phaeosphaeriaceae sp. SRC1lsM3a]|nr:hypothetical protein IQ06DRAFT_291991 [Stagonospora sp. SRC1lsM3a]